MEEENTAIELFHDFIITILSKCSKIDKRFIWSIMQELKKTTLGMHPSEVFDHYPGYLDYDPENEWWIPELIDGLTKIREGCDQYIAENPRDLRSGPFNQYANGIIEFRANYVDMVLHAAHAVYPIMKEATEDNNVALVNIAFLHPEIFWTCFWEKITGLTRILQYEYYEDAYIRLLHFIKQPIQRDILTKNAKQWVCCKEMLQKIIDTKESQKPANRVLHLGGRAFNLALEITGLTLQPHETLLSEGTREGMSGVLTRRSAAGQGLVDRVFFRT